MDVELSRRTVRDLRRIPPGRDRQRLLEALETLAADSPNLDVKSLEARPPWRRLRVGDWRVLYRPIQRGLWVERIVHRRDLEKGWELSDQRGA